MSGKSFIQKTGTLAVNSNPGGAKITLINQYSNFFSEEEILKNKNIFTPYKIKSLLPGNYLLSFELDGYWPWQQKVSVYSEQTTYVEDVVLFKKSSPIIFFNSEVQNINIDSYGKSIALQKTNQVVNLSNSQEIILSDDTYNVSFLGDKKILVNGNSIFDYSRDKYLSVDNLDLGNSKKIKIIDGNLYYLNNGLHSYSFFTKKEEYILNDKRLIEYDLYNNGYCYIFSDVDNYVLKAYSYWQKEPILVTTLPSNGEYEILSSFAPTNFIYVYDHNFKTLYIINLASKFSSYWAVLNNVENINFIDNGNFVYSSGFEIYSYNSILAEEFLIGRFDSIVSGLVWHPKNYLIYSTENDIVILDLKHNNYSIKLVTLDKVGNLVLDKLGSVLYFTGSIDNQSGVYKLLIQ
ncbi:MAG: hypothetical protein PHU32_05065 [Candidatus ainarchaeum sp.]|nr:hypothetical protein [Candidatus ainarchaeum sp.]